jgi:deoxyribodipyrimidine photo-lyase
MTDNVCSIVWFRRDLRLDDNLSLFSALQLKEKVQPVFIFDTDILSRFTNKQDRRLSFIAETLFNMHNDIIRKGGKLLVFHGSAKELIPKIAIMLKAKNIFAGIDYEPASTKRDEHVQKKLKQHNINLILQNDHLLISPEEVLKSDKTPYKVFTPYANNWYKTLSTKHLKYYQILDQHRYLNNNLELEIKPINLSKGPEYILKQIDYEYVSIKPWFTNKVEEQFNNFVKNKLNKYAVNRDFVALDGTSKLSPYIRFGLISVRKCYNAVIEKTNSLNWIRELIWRDFYASILHYFPNTVNQEFLSQYRKIKWDNNYKYFRKWQKGLTGFPIIDAAMRQLQQEGWMHNRARMIVASFLTKDLLIDWRLGEEYFAQNLMDYELASNVGGWQWAASVGTDAQPYFRVFNPTTQSIKFDPQGLYIKKYLPELKEVPIKFIHNPKKYDSILSYPDQIIDHDLARKQAIFMFSKAKSY